ncbi:MAG: respiratory nitrate reductase subunit gamma [Candidatus Zixiibacteriota bacterium]|nr:MAG: respiratory nitrate reductase subunit gamma [candidate division Zixibacteria bacterium]
MSLLQVLSYLAVLIFIISVAAKMIRIARMPLHLRWDLYPIPHEKGKAEYGGSYFETVDWWTKPKNISLISELKEMLKEIVLIQSVYENNRPLWVFSFPFHFGMYCLIAFVVLLGVGAILSAAGVEVSAASSSVITVILHHLTVTLGTAGWLLSAVGAFGLLLLRTFASQLRRAAVLSDYVNLLFLLAVFVTGYWTYQTADPAYAQLRGYIQSLITFQPAAPLSGAGSVLVWLTVALLVYFPFTHMTHMFGKYFTYHKVRWEDEPNQPGGSVEKAVAESLGRRVTWNAPHVKTGGTWAEAATASEENDKDE